MTPLQLCLICALLMAIVGQLLFGLGAATAIQNTALFCAAFYFGRWVKRRT